MRLEGGVNADFELQDFNPRTREGCDGYRIYAGSRFFGISIHAPVKGATWAARQAMPWGISSNFNPRTREGCDGLQIGSVTICSLINHIASRLKGSSIFESIIRVLLIFIEIKTVAKLRYILCVILLRTAFSLG